MLLLVLPLKLVQLVLVLKLVIFADPAVCFALCTEEEIFLVFLDNFAFGCHIHLDKLGTPCHIVAQVILKVGSILGWSDLVHLLQVVTNSSIWLPSGRRVINLGTDRIIFS